MPAVMIIANATLLNGTRADMRVDKNTISAMAACLTPHAHEVVIDANGGAALPGLHDHHIHLFALAASMSSFDCGKAGNSEHLAQALQQASRPGQWLRAVNYHESIAGAIGRAWLDRVLPDNPVRVQHRSGRLWIFNSAAIGVLAQNDNNTPLEHEHGVFTGRLYDGDLWLGQRLNAGPPDLAPVGILLAQHGVTAITDATPANGLSFFNLMNAAQASGALPQRVAVMGTSDVLRAPATPNLFPLAIKVHLHEGDYPAPDDFMQQARAAHAAGLGIAVHCVTEADLIFTLSLLEETVWQHPGAAAGARIEHASVVPPHMIQRIADAGITIVHQPNFVAERGDSYIDTIPRSEHANLYRCRSLHEAGIKLGGGTDAPFGHSNPWAAMHAAVIRRTANGALLGPDERVSPEAALALFTTELTAPGGQPRILAEGAQADICVLRQPWCHARENLADVEVRATIAGGRLIHHTLSKNQAGRKIA